MERTHSEGTAIMDWKARYAELELRLQELGRLYNISLDLIRKATTPQELLDTILDEYVHRFGEIPGANLLASDNERVGIFEREKVRSLLLFASEAVLLKENADIYAALGQKNAELVDLTQQLQEANTRLQSLNAHYLNMLSFVSHELRSPLISLLGFAELLQDGLLGELSPEQRHAVEIVCNMAKHLIDMIRNYLDLAKIEMGELLLARQKVDVRGDIIEVVIAEMQEQWTKKGMRLLPDGPPSEEPVIVEGDVQLLKIIFTNLFSNAIKYGNPGTDILYSIREGDGEHVFSVFNEGKGVPAAELERIFEKFSHVEDGSSPGPRGTGLGLHNTRWIVRAHGGEIWAESEYGRWFKVSFTLPKPTGDESPPAVVRSAAADLRSEAREEVSEEVAFALPQEIEG